MIIMNNKNSHMLGDPTQQMIQAEMQVVQTTHYSGFTVPYLLQSKLEVLRHHESQGIVW